MGTENTSLSESLRDKEHLLCIHVEEQRRKWEKEERIKEHLLCIHMKEQRRKERTKNTYCVIWWRNKERSKREGRRGQRRKELRTLIVIWHERTQKEGREKQGRDKEHLLFWHRNEVDTLCDFSFCMTNLPHNEWIHTFLTLLWHRNVRHRRLYVTFLFWCQKLPMMEWTYTFMTPLWLRNVCYRRLYVTFLFWCQKLPRKEWTYTFITPLWLRNECHKGLYVTFLFWCQKRPMEGMNIYFSNTVVTQKRVPQRALCHFSLLMPKTSHARNEHILS